MKAQYLLSARNTICLILLVKMGDFIPGTGWDWEGGGGALSYEF
jgi:hypothetical protein